MAAKNDLLNTLLLSARRGSGGAKMLSAQQLQDLYEYAARQSMIVDGIEAFKVTEKFDIPHVALTISASELHESYASLSWEQRITAMKDVIMDLLQETKRIGGEFRFNAWVSLKEDWKS
ncbi:MAG: hypothetical protein AAGC95_12315 [Pseudomonadota bacterium]